MRYESSFFWHVDSFASKAFGGNPAGVCFISTLCEETWMAALAAELNLPATAFLSKAAKGYHLRWFTPTAEIHLCGHATLAAAHALWEGAYLMPDELAVFQTSAGTLTCSRKNEWIEMDFPARVFEPAEAQPGFSEALGTRIFHVGRLDSDYLVEVRDEQTVRTLNPRHELLGKLPLRGMIVTARGQGEYDFVSRFFAPAIGVPEDAVTGSAHAALGPYWASRIGKAEMLAFQASRRGGVIRVRVDGSRVALSGTAVTILRGELTT